MILRRTADLAQIRPALAALLDRFKAENWIVFNPSFIVSSDDNRERESIEVVSSLVEVACRLSGEELLLRIETDRIGFDWTDLAIESDACSAISASDTCYLQCVDAGTWYLVSDAADVLKLFEQHGFSDFDGETLPFPRLSL